MISNRPAVRLFIVVAALCVALLATAGHATSSLRDRVFVASYGTDTNNTTCSFTQPCRTFGNAILFVAPGGEITAIDSAGFGPVNITQPVTITSPDGVEAGIVPSAGTDAVTINTTGDVFLRGLTIEGNDASANGISVLNLDTPTTLSIVHCVIRHFTNHGIYLLPQSATIKLSILNTISSNNGHDGIEIVPSNGFAQGEINHTTTDNNGTNGIAATNASLTVANSVSTNNGNDGYNAGINAVITVRDSIANDNANAGFHPDNGTILLAHSMAVGNTIGVLANNGAAVSFGDNYIHYNNQGGDVSPSNALGSPIGLR